MNDFVVRTTPQCPHCGKLHDAEIDCQHEKKCVQLVEDLAGGDVEKLRAMLAEAKACRERLRALIAESDEDGGPHDGGHAVALYDGIRVILRDMEEGDE